MFGPLFHWHQKSSLAGGFFRTHRTGTRRGKKKMPFRSKGTGSLAGAWRCIVDISEGCCQPDWKKGFFESTSLEKGVFWEHHVEYIHMTFILDVYSIEEYVFEKEANTQSVSKDLPMTNPQHFRSSSNWSRPQCVPLGGVGIVPNPICWNWQMLNLPTACGAEQHLQNTLESSCM